MNISNYRQVAAMSLILLLGLFLAWSLSGFLTAFLSAIMIYVLVKPLMRYLINHRHWNKTLATFSILLLTVITVLVPFWLLFHLLSDKINYVITHSSDIMLQIQNFDNYFFTKTGNHLLSDETMKKIQENIASGLPLLLGKTAGALGTIGMMYFILYYLIINIGKTEELVNNILPVSTKNAKRFATELESMVYSNVLGAPVLAILQGLFAGLGFWIFGLEEPWFWGVICGFMSFVPLVGTAIIWVPAGIYQLVNSTHWQGYGILIFGVVIITNIDHVFRFTIQKRFSDVHPLVTVLGVLIGIDYFGIPGLVFGPLMISYFLLMIKMYNEEYGNENTN